MDSTHLSIKFTAHVAPYALHCVVTTPVSATPVTGYVFIDPITFDWMGGDLSTIDKSFRRNLLARNISEILANLALGQPVSVPYLNHRPATRPVKPPPTDFDVELVVLLGRHDPKPAYAARHARTGLVTMVVSRTAWAAYRTSRRGGLGTPWESVEGRAHEVDLLADVLAKQLKPCLRL